MPLKTGRNPARRSGAGFFRFHDADRHTSVHAVRRAARLAQRRGHPRLLAGLRDLRHAQRRAQQRRADLPRAQRLAPRGGHLPRPGEVRRLVGHHDRPRQAGRHRPLLRHRCQQPRLLLRLHRPDAREPRHRPRVRRRLPGGDGGRLGRRPGPPARRPGHPDPGRGDGRQPRRHAGAVVDAAASATGAPCGGDRQRPQPQRREHRLQRGGAPRHRHRPRLSRRPLLPARRDPEARPRATCATRATSSASTSTPTPTC
ncbi:MAG: hypothetical protein K0S57_4102 [Ramlibacter sp.]|nr:hypothetical protein [Ramlibacter sp.]